MYSIAAKEKWGGDILTTKKDIVIAILTTFCLTATLFFIVPTRSEPDSPYDPMFDWNGDGRIGPADFAVFSVNYGKHP